MKFRGRHLDAVAVQAKASRAAWPLSRLMLLLAFLVAGLGFATPAQAQTATVTWDASFVLVFGGPGGMISSGDSVAIGTTLTFNFNLPTGWTYSALPSGCNIAQSSGDTWQATITETCHVSGSETPIFLSNMGPSVAVVGEPYFNTIFASGGNSPYQFAVESGDLPAGVTLDDSGTFFGIPREVGSFTFTVRAVNGHGHYTTTPLTLTVNPPAVTPTLSIDDVTITEGGSGGNFAIFNISLDSPAPSGGVTFDIATQNNTATAGSDYAATSLTSVSINPGNFGSSFSVQIYADTDAEPDETFFVNVTNISGATASDSQGLGTILDDDAPPPIANDVSATVSYGSTNNTITLNIGGGVATSVSVVAPPTHGTATPTGTSITYTPTAGYGGPDSFTYTATNGAGVSAPATVTITVSPPIVTKQPINPPDGTVGVPYSQSIAGASGGTGPYTYVFAGGELPPGMNLSPDGTLSGTPTNGRQYSFYVMARDSSTGNGPYDSAPSQVLVSFGWQTPTIASVSPSFGPTSGGTPVTITGTGFTGATAVSFDGTPATSFTVDSDTSIRATAPPHAAGVVAVAVTTPHTTISRPNAFQYQAPSPTIISISPNVGLPGTVVTITGTNLTGTSSIRFDGVVASGINVVNDTMVTVTTPAHPGGLVDVELIAAGGSVTAADAFTFAQPPPTANPVSATVAHGSTNNPITLNITGATPTSVSVATPPAHGTTNVSGTSITYTPAAGYAGPDSFTYTAGNGAGTSAPATVTITVSDPTIVYTPGNPPAGTVGVAYSQNLASASGGSAPYSYALASGATVPGLVLATDGTLSGTPTATGTFALKIRATDSSTGTGPFSSASADVSVTIDPAVPSIASVTPTTGLTTGGTSVTIGGTGFAGVTAVSFGGTAAASFTVNSDTSITATTPAHAAGAADVMVITLGGGDTLAGAFTYVAPVVPSLSVSDVTVTEGDSGEKSAFFTVSIDQPTTTPVTLDIATADGTATAGDDYLADAAFGVVIAPGLPNRQFMVKIRGDAVHEPDETFFVNVTNVVGATVVDGQGLGTILNDDVAIPTISSLAPGSGTTAGGTSVVITGTGLIGATAVSFGGTAAMSFAVNGDTSITATTPPHAAGAVAVEVTTPGGSASLASGFTYVVPAPTVASVTPDSGLTTGGASVTITGTNLTGATSVSFGGTAAASYTVNNDTSITATTPPHAAGAVAVEVATPGGNASLADAFTYALPPPVANPVSATVAYGSSDNPITLNITGGPATSVAIGTLPTNGTATATSSSVTYTPTPGYAGSDSFTYTASNGADTSAPATVTITVSPPTITYAPTNPPAGIVGVAYNQSVAGGASGGTAPYAYSLSGSSLPPGLALSADGVLSGTPTTAGTFNVSIVATDSSTGTGPFSSAPATISVAIDPAIPTIASVAPDNGLTTGGTSVAITGAAFTGATSVAFGGAAATNFTVNSDTSITATTPAHTAGAVAVEVTTPGGNASLPNAFTYAVPVPTANPVNVTVAYGSSDNPVPLNITGGPATSVAVGTVPANGTATATGTSITYTPTPGYAGPDSFTYTAGNGTGVSAPATVTVTVSPPTIAYAPGNPQQGVVGVAYSQSIAGANGGTDPYAYSLSAGDLPSGIVLSTDGTLHGTPSAAGIFSFSVIATDSSSGTGPFSSAPANVSLAIDPAVPTIVSVAPVTGLTTGGTSVTITGTALTGATVVSFGGTAAASFAVDSDTSITAMTPAHAEGSVEVVVTTPGGSATMAGAFNYEAPPSNNANLSNLVIGTGTLNPAFAPDVTSYAVTVPHIVSSLNLTPTSADIHATITVNGDSVTSGSATPAIPLVVGDNVIVVEVTAEDAITTRAYRVTVSRAEPVITINPDALPGGTGGVAYGPVTLTADGGTAPYEFTVAAGGLPAGLSIATTGELTGTPTETGDFTFTVTARDGNGFTGAHEYTLAIDAPEITLMPTSLADGRVNRVYGATLAAAGGTQPYRFAVTAGNLPDGLELAPDGALSGTPTAAGSFAFIVTATDNNGFSGSRDYSLAIEDLTLPGVQDHTLSLMAGMSGTLDLTQGATHGPFTNAAIVSYPDERAGTTRIERDGSSYVLHFAAASTFAGSARLTYTLSNADGASRPGTVAINVIARPDPALDPEVIGLIRAQTETAKRFADTQVSNFSRRLEQLHNEGERRNNSVDVNIDARKTSSSADAYAAQEAAPKNPARDAIDRASPQQASGPDPRSEPVDDLFGDFAIWSGGYVNFGTNDDGALNLDHTLVGLSAGVDYRFSPELTAGFGVGYGRDVTDVGGNGTESRAEAFSLAAYGSYRPTPGLFIDGLAGYSAMTFDSRRYATPTGDFAVGDRNGNQLFAAVSAGYEYRQDGLLISPYGRLFGSHSKLDAFTETGAGIWNLTFGEQTINTFSGTLGLRFEYAIPTTWGVLTPRGRLEYTHDFEGSSRASLGYADLGTLPHWMDVEPFSRDHLSIGLGLDAQIGKSWNVGFDYRTTFGTDGDSQDHTFGLQLKTQF